MSDFPVNSLRKDVQYAILRVFRVGAGRKVEAFGQKPGPATIIRKPYDSIV